MDPYRIKMVSARAQIRVLLKEGKLRNVELQRVLLHKIEAERLPEPLTAVQRQGLERLRERARLLDEKQEEIVMEIAAIMRDVAEEQQPEKMWEAEGLLAELDKELENELGKEEQAEPTDEEREEMLRAMRASRETHELERLREAQPAEARRDAQDAGQCVVCQDEQAVIAVVDCGHLALCTPCSENIMRSTQQCPLCRTRIQTQQRLIRMYRT